MPRKKTIVPTTPREFLSEVRDLIGDSFLIKLFYVKRHKNPKCTGCDVIQKNGDAGTGQRALNRWTAKRPYVGEDSIRENWIEKHERLLERLAKTPGGLELAISNVDRFAAIVGCELMPLPQNIHPDADTIEGECLDDYPALASFHEAIRNNNSPESVRNAARHAKTEIDETIAAYFEQDEP